MTAPVVDGGALTGVPPTAVDLTGDNPRMLRQGAASIDAAGTSGA